MEKTEWEQIIPLNQRQFRLLYGMLSSGAAQRTEVIHYYYDTPDERLRSRNITCRIRQDEARLTGIYRQESGTSAHGVEKKFSVRELPEHFTVNGIQVSLKGAVSIESTAFPLNKSLTLILDRNRYLGVADYELKIEFDRGAEECAKTVITLLNRIFKRDCPEGPVSPVSERFFRRLHGMLSADGRK